MNPKLKETKEWLKNEATKIRKTKHAYKDAQRNGRFHLIWDLALQLGTMKDGYRYRHIAYSLYRGRTMEQIEKPKKSLPIMDIIDGYLDEIRSGEPKQ